MVYGSVIAHVPLEVMEKLWKSYPRRLGIVERMGGLWLLRNYSFDNNPASYHSSSNSVLAVTRAQSARLSLLTVFSPTGGT